MFSKRTWLVTFQLKKENCSETWLKICFFFKKRPICIAEIGNISFIFSNIIYRKVMEEQNGTAVDAAIATLFCNGLIGWVTFGPLESFFNPYFSNPRKKITFKSHCEKFLLRNLNVGMDVAIFLFQLVVQIQPLVFLNQVPTHLLDKHIGIIQW